MSAKKTNTNLQINVSFVGDTTKLVKDLQTNLKSLKLDSPLTKDFKNNMSQGFKEVFTNLNKMSEGLSKKGLNTKQYTDYFNNMNLKIKESVKFVSTLKTELQDIFNSQENKEALKDLEKYRKQLQEINKLSTAQKGAQTRKDTAIQKLYNETGIDYNISKRMLSNIANKKASRQKFTKTQEEWLSSYGLDENKLKRVLDLLKQINAQNSKIDEQNRKAKSLSGQSTVSSATLFTEKQVEKLEGTAITSDTLKGWMSIISQSDNLIKQVADSGERLSNNFNTELPRATKEAEKLAKATSTIREIFGQFGIAFSAATIVNSFQQLARSAFDFYKSLDSALNEIYIVSNLTIDNVNSLKTNFINMAKETGVAIDDVTRSAVLFYQQGLSTDEVLEMTEVTSQFAKVAGIDATDAADKLTAAVNGYCLAAEDASMVADKFNKVAAASAADINELSTAFSKAAAQANQAGVSMDNYLAYIATMVEATREAPENIGTSLKTIFSRMQQVKEAGSSEDGETDVNQVETALRSVGIALRDSNNELRDLEEIFDELGPKWNSLDRNTQAYLGTIIAGTRQQSRFITLMQNWDRVLDLADQSANSAGQQALMHAKAMDSIQSKLNQFQVAWQEFVSNLASSDLFKGIFVGLTKILDLLNGGNQPIILLSTAIGLLSTKLKDLQGPLVQRVKDLGELFKKVKEGFSSGFNFMTFSSLDDKKKALTSNKIKQEGVQKALELKNNELGIIINNSEGVKTAKEQNELAIQRRKIEEEIVRLKNEQKRLTKEENDINNAFVGKFSKIRGMASQIGKAGIPVGIGLQAAGMAIGANDTNLAGVVGTIGTGLTAIGQLATGNVIGGLVSGGMAIYQGFQAWENWDENIAAKLTESVNKVTDSMNELTNTNTKSKGLKSLIDDYRELNSKTFLTAEEQEKLNTTIQTMGESLNIDVITDSYGNLAINIDEVTKKYKEMAQAQEDALREMKELEDSSLEEAMSGLGNKNTRSDFYRELYKTNTNNYRALLNGIQDNLTENTRSINDTLYQSINNTFKNSIEDTINKNLDYFAGTGLADSFVNLEKGIMDKIEKEDWNYLYQEIEYFQQNVNNLSWDEFITKFEDAFGTWRKEIGLTTDEWIVLRDTIQNTIYSGQKEYIDFMNSYDESAAGDYALYKEKYEQMQQEVKKANLDNLRYTQTEFKNVISGYENISYEGFEEIYKVWKENGKKWKDYNWVFEDVLGHGNNLYDGEMFDEADITLDELDDLLSRYDASYEKYMEIKEKYEKDGGAKELKDAMDGLKGEARNKITSIGSLFDRSDFYLNSEGEEVTNYEDVSQDNKDKINRINEIMAEVVKSAEGEITDSDIGLAMIKAINSELENGEDLEGVDEYLEKVKEEIENEMPRTGTYTWSGIAESLDSYSSSLQTTNKALKELNQTGAISFDTFSDLAKTMDSLSFEDVFASFSDAEEGMQYINGLSEALDNLDTSYDANTGSIKMNTTALEYLQDAQERAAKGKIKNTIKELAASKATAESQVAYIEAQMAAVEAMMLYIQNQGDQQINMQDMMAAANSAYTTSFGDEMAKVSNNYSIITGDSLEWASVTISHIAEVTDAWSKYWAAVRDGSANAEELKKEANKLSKGYFSSEDDFYEGTNIKISEYDGVKASSAKGKELLSQLQSYYSGLEKAKAQYSKTVSMYEGSIKLLNSLYNSDLSKLGSDSATSEAIDKYISQLEEMLDLITHIERESQKFSLYQSLYDIQTGSKAIDNLKEQIKIIEHLTEDYEKAFNIQKDSLKLKAQEIKDVYGSAITFAEDGSYKINQDAYDKLNDENKEALDNLIGEYDELIDKVDEYYGNLISSMQEEKELRQSYVDTYIEAEDELVEAIKQREQKILDNKLAAIDKEIEAIEKASEARRKAREEEQNAEELSSMQIDLQRALMDSSGASATQILEMQKQIKDKQQEMADSSFDTMVDDMKEQLEDEKEMEQKLFDERLEEMDWYWDEVDRIMSEGTESILSTMQMYLDEYNQSSELQQTELLKGWEDTFGRAVAIGQAGAKNMQTIISELQKIISGVDIDGDLGYLVGVAAPGYKTTDVLVNKEYKYASMKKYASGGMAYHTGPAWLDGTASQPEAVLSSLQTKAFLSFTDSLAALRTEGNIPTNSSITIDSISFNVESMSSIADGEKAFNTFVDKFKEIGAKQGISIIGTANRN